MFETLRNRVFWGLDRIRGGRISRHYADLKAWHAGAPQACERREEKLQELLRHACREVPRYASFEGRALEEFPLISKAARMDAPEDFRARSFHSARLHTMRTSGSTGMPFAVGQDRGKRARVLAELLFFGHLLGYAPGDRNAFLRTRHRRTWASPMKNAAKNLLLLDAGHLDSYGLETLWKSLERERRLRLILGYASSLDRLGRHMMERGYRFQWDNLRAVVTGAELLQEDTRGILKTVFRCPVLSRYSNQENGILAQEFQEGRFQLNMASYHFEFLDLSEDRPAPPGVPARIVVTDLYNCAEPMIRYDTGDVGVYGHHPEKGRVLESIEGRLRDFIYDTGDRLISPSMVTVLLSEWRGLRQYQFRQLAKGTYTLTFVASQPLDDEALEQALRGVLGPEAVLTLRPVDAIAENPGGKRHYVINDYKKTKAGRTG